MSDLEQCGTCRFYIAMDITENGKKVGHCHFFPPLPMDTGFPGARAKLRASEIGCGQHQKRLELEPQTNVKRSPVGHGARKI